MHISRQAIPEFNGGNTLDKKGKPDPGVGEFSESRVGRAEGNARSRNNQEHRTTHAAGT